MEFEITIVNKDLMWNTVKHDNVDYSAGLVQRTVEITGPVNDTVIREILATMCASAITDTVKFNKLDKEAFTKHIKENVSKYKLLSGRRK